MVNNKIPKILIILFTSDFYKYYYGLNIASSYKATNKNVTLFYSGYAINFLSKCWKDYDKKNTNKKLIEKNMPNYLEMLDICIQLKVSFYFCKTAMEFLNLSEDDLMVNLNIKSAPLYHILNKYKNSQTIFI